MSYGAMPDKYQKGKWIGTKSVGFAGRYAEATGRYDSKREAMAAAKKQFPPEPKGTVGFKRR